MRNGKIKNCNKFFLKKEIEKNCFILRFKWFWENFIFSRGITKIIPLLKVLFCNTSVVFVNRGIIFGIPQRYYRLILMKKEENNTMMMKL